MGLLDMMPRDDHEMGHRPLIGYIDVVVYMHEFDYNNTDEELVQTSIYP
jgi:hypothetical protein